MPDSRFQLLGPGMTTDGRVTAIVIGFMGIGSRYRYRTSWSRKAFRVRFKMILYTIHYLCFMMLDHLRMLCDNFKDASKIISNFKVDDRPRLCN